MIEVIDFFRRLFGYHDSNGLRFHPQWLAAVRPHIPYYSRKRQAKYADGVCREMVKESPEMLWQQVPDDAEPNSLHTTNTTGIGNLAYVALHAPQPEIRLRAEKQLLFYRRWLESFTAN